MNELEVYNGNEMPLSQDIELRSIQQKILNNYELTISEKRRIGRDNPVQEIDGYKLKPDCVYRAVSKELYERYLDLGFIYGDNENDEYEENQNNKGVNWYLGGACPKYGEVILECPAYKEYFIPTKDNGCGMACNPRVRHMKSSGYKKPVPISLIKVIKHPDYKLEELIEIEFLKK